MLKSQQMKKSTTKQYSKTVIVTGGLGFIGSEFLRRFVPFHADWLFINVDDKREGSNVAAVASIENLENYKFVRCALEDVLAVQKVFDTYWPITDVIHFAADSDVDRSIKNPSRTYDCNVTGTLNLLEAFRSRSGYKVRPRFVQVSTDEVYGPLTFDQSPRVETDILNPKNPYSASKAAAEHAVQAYANTWGLDIVITRGCNTFGPWQMPTKIIPRAVRFLQDGKKMPMYGDGQYKREWMPVEMHAEAVFWVWQDGMSGEVYNVGTGFECTNQRVLQLISETLKKNEPTDLHIESVTDRLGHDRRYALDTKKLRDLGWIPDYADVETSISAVASWYWDNRHYDEHAVT